MILSHSTTSGATSWEQRPIKQLRICRDYVVFSRPHTSYPVTLCGLFGKVFAGVGNLQSLQKLHDNNILPNKAKFPVLEIIISRFSFFYNAGWGFSAWTEKRLEARCKSLLGLEKDMCKLERCCKLETLTLVNRCSIHEAFLPFDFVWWTLMNFILIDILLVFDTGRLPGQLRKAMPLFIFVSWFLIFSYMYLDLSFRRLMILLQHGSLKGRISTSIALVQETEGCR